MVLKVTLTFRKLFWKCIAGEHCHKPGGFFRRHFWKIRKLVQRSRR